MMLALFLTVVGLLMVLKGGDVFVRASLSLSERLNIPPMIVGGTLASLATSLPEWIVSLLAAKMGNSGIAIGNVIGSNIANIALVGGVLCLMPHSPIKDRGFKDRCYWMIAVTLLLITLSLRGGLSQRAGLFLFAMGILYLMIDLLKCLRQKNNVQTGLSHAGSVRKDFLLIFTGAFVLILGSRFLVEGSVDIAEYFQVPSLLIGLTIVAVGTSLPELATAILSAKNNSGDFAIGTIVGSNILNVSLIAGSSLALNPTNLSGQLLNISLAWLLATSLYYAAGMRWSFIFSKKSGILLLMSYLIYTLWISQVSI